MKCANSGLFATMRAWRLAVRDAPPLMRRP
jgi:hypothetical protein